MKRPAPFDVLTATRPIGVSPMPAQAFLPELFPMPVSLHPLHEETMGLLSEELERNITFLRPNLASGEANTGWTRPKSGSRRNGAASLPSKFDGELAQGQGRLSSRG